VAHGLLLLTGGLGIGLVVDPLVGTQAHRGVLDLTTGEVLAEACARRVLELPVGLLGVGPLLRPGGDRVVPDQGRFADLGAEERVLVNDQVIPPGL
jgi:hypothetical protein